MNSNKKKETVYKEVSLECINSKKEVLTSFFLNDCYVPMTKKQIIKFLEVPQADLYLFCKVLETLENEAFIYIDDSKRYRVVKNTETIKCKYQGKNEKFGFAICNDKKNSNIYIERIDSLGAIDGDDILVSIKQTNKESKNDNKIYGRVVKIIKRNTTTIIGRYIKNTNFGFVEPLNRRILDVYIPKKNSRKFKNDDIVELKITKFPTIKNKAEGNIIRKISSWQDEMSEVKGMYESFNISKLKEFSKSVLDEISKISDTVLKEEKINRVDRTHERVYTIDSEDAKDLDDAVCVKKIDESTYLLSVYIADVSHYVKEKTNLDKEAINRSTSIYIPNDVVPMLPKKLSNGICSLNQGVERLVLAVDQKIDINTGRVIDSDIFKAVIKVTKKMSYDKVYKALMNIDEDVIEEYKLYYDDLVLFKKLAEALKNKRNKMGAIDFDIKETKVILDDNGNILDVKPYEITFANRIIEEFMLSTNMTIAKTFNSLNIPFIYRVHENPDDEKIRELNEFLGKYGKRIKNIKNIHSKSFLDILEGINDKKEKEIISKVMLRTLKLARYSNECIGHFGLAAKYYCHFTSPIRRYPDLFIHRVISECIDKNFVLSEEDMLKFTKQAEKYCLISTEAEKEATKIEREFVDLYKCIYMKNFVGKKFNATVSSITSFGMFVELENTVEGLVPFDLLKENDYFDYDEKHKILIGRKTKKVYSIGDEVLVKLTRVDVRSRQIDFKII